ncbi:MAG: DUF2141 domain-containing protein [Stenotrophobium sp.]
MQTRQLHFRGAAALLAGLALVGTAHAGTLDTRVTRLRPTVVNAAYTGTLDVRLTHLRPTGMVRVAVYGDAEHWRQERGPVAVREFPARDISYDLSFDGLAPGKYAVRVDQDAGSGTLALHMPAFGYTRHGVSRDAGRYGTPSFDKAAVEVEAGDPQISIPLFIDE